MHFPPVPRGRPPPPAPFELSLSPFCRAKTTYAPSTTGSPAPRLSRRFTRPTPPSPAAVVAPPRPSPRVTTVFLEGSHNPLVLAAMMALEQAGFPPHPCRLSESRVPQFLGVHGSLPFPGVTERQPTGKEVSSPALPRPKVLSSRLVPRPRFA